MKFKIHVSFFLYLLVTIISLNANNSKKSNRMCIFIDDGSDSNGSVLFEVVSVLSTEASPVLMTRQLLEAWTQLMNKDFLYVQQASDLLNQVNNLAKQGNNAQNVQSIKNITQSLKALRSIVTRNQTSLLHVNFSRFDIYKIPFSSWILFLPKSFNNIYEINITDVNGTKHILTLQKLLLNKQHHLQTNNSTTLSQIDSWEKYGFISTVLSLKLLFNSVDNIKTNHTIQELLKDKSSFEQQEILNSIKSEMASWNFYIKGHGSSYENIKKGSGQIANLYLEDFQKLLQLLNIWNAEFVAIVTCFAGGQNIDFMQIKKNACKNDVMNHFNYILALISSGDLPSTSWNNVHLKKEDNPLLQAKVPTKYIPGPLCPDYNSFFSILEKKSSANWLTEALEQVNSSEALLPQNIPQVWIPHTGWFQTFLPAKTKTISSTQKRQRDKIFILGEVLVNQHFLEKKDIVIQNKSVVMIYPTVVPKKLYINQNFFHNDTELYERTKALSFISIATHLPRHLYPTFLSMKKGNTVHVINQIEVTGSRGVFHFIHEAFSGMQEQAEAKTFFICSLSGNASNIFSCDTLKNVFKSNLYNKITLNDVFIRCKDAGESQSYFHLIFTWNGQHHQFYFEKNASGKFNAFYTLLQQGARDLYANILKEPLEKLAEYQTQKITLPKPLGKITVPKDQLQEKLKKLLIGLQTLKNKLKQLKSKLGDLKEKLYKKP